MKKGLAKLTLALMAAGAISTSAHAATTLVYCSEGSPEGFNPGILYCWYYFRCDIEKHVQPFSRIQIGYDRN